MLQQTNTLHVAIRAASDLTATFSASVFGTQPPSSLTCGEPGSNQVQFFLDPFEDKECAGADFILVFMMSVVIFVLTWWGRWFIWEPLADLRISGSKKHFDPSVKKRFGVTLTSIIVHVCSAFFVFRILVPTEWLYKPSCWVDNIDDDTIDADLKFYYLLYLARYCSDSVSILFEERRKDQFLQMVYHHAVTIGLVVCSINARYTRFGGVIMFFFDWADIPLQCAKASKYLSVEPKDFYNYVANRLFELFAITYFLTRNCMFNFVVYTALRDLPDTSSGATARILLVMLAAIQTFWLTLLIKAVKKQIANGGNVEDIREEDKKKFE
ncbi:unnamed protein product [Cylindrotheca closterium]|uniref:TLC domain-containing protein n=1 Tax=Cylindrotheca closterium TaxID=2856 RepID=A0AAD2G3V1_9STRA|nr:unnamed protein product [Cylindrotheca closterium]